MTVIISDGNMEKLQKMFEQAHKDFTEEEVNNLINQLINAL